MAIQGEIICVNEPISITRTIQKFETPTCSKSEDSPKKVNVFNLLENFILLGLCTLEKWEMVVNALKMNQVV